MPRAEPETQAVALAARDHVQVQVRHALADDVVDDHERALARRGALDRALQALREVDPRGGELERQGVVGDDVAGRHEQGVPREEWADVEERHEVVGAQHLERERALRDDLAERAWLARGGRRRHAQAWPSRSPGTTSPDS
ncbi:hypothetical protein GCM10025869_36420 [Homoserinibacter gongjuensis]|uniref:Uncharacterized protein n=1 Tax=Homoserinibacter gongjuensis TaxID=1162968 RepID=A0ABQ6JXZ9_9MICO|nr:hypothetical protein GCM10025869_36420 [Homoserinibacter gongjuensis]